MARIKPKRTRCASNVKRTQSAEIEAGRSYGSVETMKKLSEALGVMVDDLI